MEKMWLSDHTQIPVFVIEPQKALKVPSLHDTQEFPDTPDPLLNPGWDNKEQMSHVDIQQQYEMLQNICL